MNNKHDDTASDILKLFGSLNKPPEKKNHDVPDSVEKLLQLTQQYKKSYLK